MKEVNISFKAKVDDNIIGELQKTVDHNIGKLIDLDSYPEIESIYNAKMSVESEEINTKNEETISSDSEENNMMKIHVNNMDNVLSSKKKYKLAIRGKRIYNVIQCNEYVELDLSNLTNDQIGAITGFLDVIFYQCKFDCLLGAGLESTAKEGEWNNASC